MKQGQNPAQAAQSSPSGELSVFNYSDYREYLKDFYRLKKSKSGSYSFAVFSIRAGIKSPNYLKLVMEGQRNLTTEYALAFAKGLGLNELEMAYWENLVSFTQAKTAFQRQFFLVRLSRAQLPAGLLGEGTRLIREIRDEFDYFSSWHHPAIRELVLLPDFKADPADIAARFGGRITSDQAAASLALLSRLGFLVEAAAGTWVQAEPQINYRSRGDVANLALRRWHRETARLAAECLEDDSDEAHGERFFNGLTIAVNRKTLPLIKERIATCQRDLNRDFSIDPTTTDVPADQVYHLNFQLVPLTKHELPVKHVLKAARGKPKRPL